MKPRKNSYCYTVHFSTKRDATAFFHAWAHRNPDMDRCGPRHWTVELERLSSGIVFTDNTRMDVVGRQLTTSAKMHHADGIYVKYEIKF